MNSAPVSIATSAQPIEKQFSSLVKQFLNYLQLEKHFSDYTIKSYGADLIQFGQFLNGEIGAAQQGENKRTNEGPAALDAKLLKCEPLLVREFLAYLYAQ